MEDDPNTALLRKLVDVRRQHLSLDGGWSGYNDVEVDAAYSRLESVHRQILQFDFGGDGARLVALSLLLSGDDQPNFDDDFKNDLYRALQRSISDNAHRRTNPAR